MHWPAISCLLVATALTALPGGVRGSAWGILSISHLGKIAGNCPIQTPFQFNTPLFTRQGGFAFLNFQVDASTRCLPNVFNASNEPTPPPPNTFTETIFAVSLSEATEAGCRTFAEIDAAAKAYAPNVAALNLPTTYRTIILYLDYDSNNPDDYVTIADPLRITQYTGNGHGDDGPVPGVDFVLVSRKPLEDIVQTLIYDITPTITIISGPGPWNELFESLPYRFFAITTGLFLIGTCCQLIWTVGSLITRKEFVADLRNITFLFAFLAIVISIPTFFLRVQTYASTILSTLSNTLSSLALELLIYLWTDFLTRLERRSWTRYTKHLSWVAVLSTLLSFASNLKISTGDPTTRQRDGSTLELSRAMLITNSVVILSLGAVYLYTIFQFLLRCESARISPKAVKVLKHLAILGTFSFFSFIALATCNILMYRGKVTGPAAFLGYSLVSSYSLTFRNLALVLILGVRIPGVNHSASSDQAPVPRSESIVKTKSGYFSRVEV